MAILETPRLILRPFDEKDVDQMSELMANPDFMRSPSVRRRMNKPPRFSKLSLAGIPPDCRHPRGSYPI
jgi:RimJ/RimL family protein N-acetyltransferase